MEIALWIVTGFLAVGFLVCGIALLALPRQRYRALGRNQHWVDMFDTGTLKGLAVLKLLAAAGLALPTTLGIAAWLAPLAALGLMMYMTGATAVRVVRREWGYALGDLTFIALSGLAAWGWAFGPGAQLSC